MPIVGQFGSLAGLGSLILPGGAFESIATVTVGSGGASSIEFTSIPGTYQHLQIRALILGASGDNWMQYQFNSDTGNNYAAHYIEGNGASASAGNITSFKAAYFQGLLQPTTTYPFVMVTDILDYGSTSKTKVVRTFAGQDGNASGTASNWRVVLASGLWNSTSAITSMKIAADTRTLGQHSTFALYGLRAP